MMVRAIQSQVNYEAGKSPISIVALLEWAFQRECVSLDFSREGALGMVSRPAVSSSYLIARHAELGCRVDGGGHSLSHPDADLVADALVQLPAHVGGPRMAIWLADLARSGLTPDWCKDAQARCEPVEWKNTVGGMHAKAEVFELSRHTYRGRAREHKVRWCPVRYMNTADEVARVRRAYLGWWGALLELRTSFQIAAHLSAYRVTDEMPPMRPWRDGDIVPILSER